MIQRAETQVRLTCPKKTVEYTPEKLMELCHNAAKKVFGEELHLNQEELISKSFPWGADPSVIDQRLFNLSNNDANPDVDALYFCWVGKYSSPKKFADYIAESVAGPGTQTFLYKAVNGNLFERPEMLDMNVQGHRGTKLVGSIMSFPLSRPISMFVKLGACGMNCFCREVRFVVDNDGIIKVYPSLWDQACAGYIPEFRVFQEFCETGLINSMY